MSEKKINVLITGLSGGGHGVEILKALKMSNLNLRIVGTNNTKNSFGIPLVDEHYVVPSANEPNYIETMLDIVKKNNIDVLFHGCEPELKKISENRNLFEANGVFLPINTQKVINLCMNKIQTMDFLRSKGFPVPEYCLISSMDDVKKVKVYPVVCKPHLGGGGSNNVFIAQDEKELRSVSELVLNHTSGFIAQEYVGTYESEYTVGILSDLEGELIDSIAVKRHILYGLSHRLKVANKTNRADLGNLLVISTGISQGEIGRYRNVTKYCEEVSKAIGSKGPLNIQCRLFKDKVYIFEINPRFSGTTALRAMAGFNEPEIFIRKHILKESIPNITYKEGIILRGLEEKFINLN